MQKNKMEKLVVFSQKDERACSILKKLSKFI